jgi:hypothetical protein
MKRSKNSLLPPVCVALSCHRSSDVRFEAFPSWK